MKTKFWIIVAVGILLRLFIAYFTYHPDTSALLFGGSLIGQGNVFTFYDYLFKLSSTNPLVQNFGVGVFTYPPLIYLFHGLFNFLYSLLGLGFINNFAIVGNSSLTDPLLHLSMLLFKLPYLIFDLLLLFTLMKMFDNEKEKYWVLLLWVFNPINLFSTYMVGDHDVIAGFFIVLSLLMAKRKKISLAALSLSGGVAFKLFPIFLLIPLTLMEKRWLDRAKIFVLGVLSYIISILPYLSSKGYRATALFANQSSKSLYASIPISGGESLLLFPLVLGFFYLWFYFKGINNWWSLFKSYLIVLLVFFIFTHTHPQWFLWLTPLLIIEMVANRFKNIVLSAVMLLSFVGLLLFFDPSLSVGMFAPLFPGLSTAGSIWKILHLNLDYNFSRSVLQTIFAVAASFMIFQNLSYYE